LEKLVRERSSLTGLARALLLAIAHYAGDDGRGAYPSIATLMRDTGASDRGVQKAIKQAVNAGELKRLHNLGPHGVNRYEIRIDRLRGKAERASTKKRDHHPPPPELCSPPEPGSDKGSSIKGTQYSSGDKIRNQPLPDSPDAFAEKAAANGYLTCPDCGRYGGRCNCDSELQAGFDRAMRDTLDAGKSGPALLASEEALQQAYATLKPSDGSEHGNPKENAFPTHSHAFGGHE
jgi:hypothetical protein